MESEVPALRPHTIRISSKEPRPIPPVPFLAKGNTNCQINPLNPNAPTNCVPAANTPPSGEPSLGNTPTTNSPIQAPPTEAPTEETPSFQ